MAAFVPVPNGIKLTFVWTLFGIPVTCTLYVTTANPITTAEIDTAIGEAVNWWTAGGRGAFSQDLILSHVEGTQVDVQNGFQRVAVPGSNQAGGLAAPAVSGNVAIVASLRTPYIGRSFRGRIYLPGATEAQVGNNVVSVADAAAISANITGLLNALVTAGFTPVVASLYSLGSPRVTAVTTPIDSVIVNQRVDTQRRRLG